MNTQPRLFDVCMICALPEEVRSLLDVVQPYSDSEIEEYSSSHYQHSYCTATITNKHGEPFTLHASWLPQHGIICRTAGKSHFWKRNGSSSY